MAVTPGAGMGGGAALGTGCGIGGAAGIGTGIPGLLKEPIGGGALETEGAGAGMSDPGSGGALVTGGTAIWPISGTTLGARTGSSADRMPAAGELLAVSSFTARLICTTASTHSAPQAIAEERSRSEARIGDGGVTSC